VYDERAASVEFDEDPLVTEPYLVAPTLAVRPRTEQRVQRVGVDVTVERIQIRGLTPSNFGDDLDDRRGRIGPFPVVLVASY